MASPLDFLAGANPLALGATVLGGIGSLFGSGSKTEIPPELREIYNMLLQQSQEGLSDRTVNMLLERAKTNIGNEAGALGALTEARLTRQGAGTGVKQTALNRINKQRLSGIGEATTTVGLADEQAKQEALNRLAQLAPMFGDESFRSQYGQGFSDLLGAGLGYLLNRPREGENQPKQTSRFLDRYDYGYDPYKDVA